LEIKNPAKFFFPGGVFMTPEEQRYLLMTEEDEKFLIVADFHIGLELETLRDTGVRLEGLSDSVVEEFCDLVEMTNATSVFILGDLEHTFRRSRSISGESKNSVFSTSGFFQRKFKEQVLEPIGALEATIVLVCGNHDVNSKKILPPSVRVIGPRGFSLSMPGRGRIGLLHGHAYPSFLSEELILSHIHPTVQIKEEGVDVYHRMPVFLRGVIPTDAYQSILKDRIPEGKKEPIASSTVRITIIPAFNKTLFGNAVNNPSQSIPSPFIRKLFSLVDFEIFLTDGRFLGKLSELPPSTQVPRKQKSKSTNFSLRI